jgi:hypothetical protein
VIGFIPVEHAQPMHEGMPGSTLELVDDAGHFPHLDDPVRFAPTLEAFFHAINPPRLDTDVIRELVLARHAHLAVVLERLQREHPAA